MCQFYVARPLWGSLKGVETVRRCWCGKEAAYAEARVKAVVGAEVTGRVVRKAGYCEEHVAFASTTRASPIARTPDDFEAPLREQREELAMYAERPAAWRTDLQCPVVAGQERGDAANFPGRKVAA